MPASRLVEIAERLAGEELVVAGSMGQARAHPLLGEERVLRKELADQLPKFDYLVRQRAKLERLNRITKAAGPSIFPPEDGEAAV